MPRGGRRRGQPGKAYPNRTDLNPAAQAAQVNRAPRIRAPEGVPTEGLQRTPTAARQAPQPQSFQPPGSLGPFLRPSERPSEPITAGLPVGPGPGPDALPQLRSTAADELRALFLRFPLPELRDLIELADEEARGL